MAINDRRIGAKSVVNVNKDISTDGDGWSRNIATSKSENSPIHQAKATHEKVSDGFHAPESSTQALPTRIYEIPNEVIVKVLLAFFSVIPTRKPRTQLAQQVDHIVAKTGSLRRFRGTVRDLADLLAPWSEDDNTEDEEAGDCPDLFLGFTPSFSNLTIPSSVREEILSNPGQAEELASNTPVPHRTDILVDHKTKRIFIHGKEVKRAPSPLVYDLLMVFLRLNGKVDKDTLLDELTRYERRIDPKHLPAYKHELLKYLKSFLPEISIRSEENFYALKGVSFLLIDID